MITKTLATNNTAATGNLRKPQNQLSKTRRATDATHRSSLLTACSNLVHGDNCSLEFASIETTSSYKECLPDVHVLRRSTTDSCAMYRVVSRSGQSCNHTRRSTIANYKSSLLRFFFKERKEVRKSAKSPKSNDKLEQPFEPTVSMCSMLTHDITHDDTEHASLQHVTTSKEAMSISADHVGMTEKKMYNLHLHSYLRDTMKEYLGDLLDCNDLEFLYEESDESDEDNCPENSGGVQLDNYASEDRVPMFEFCLPLSREKSPLQFDEVSEITSNDCSQRLTE